MFDDLGYAALLGLEDILDWVADHISPILVGLIACWIGLQIAL